MIIFLNSFEFTRPKWNTFIYDEKYINYYSPSSLISASNWSTFVLDAFGATFLIIDTKKRTLF